MGFTTRPSRCDPSLMDRFAQCCSPARMRRCPGPADSTTPEASGTRVYVRKEHVSFSGITRPTYRAHRLTQGTTATLDPAIADC